MFDCFRRQSGKLSLNQGHHLWVSLNIKEALLLITVRKIFVCSRRSPGNFHSNSLQLWPLQRQLQPLTLQIEICRVRGFVNKYIIIIVFPISNFNKVYSNRYSVTEIWPHHDILSLSLSLSLLNVSVYFRNNKTVNKTSRFFSFSLIMHRHLFWGGNTFRFVEFWRKKSEWQNLAKRFFLALIMSFSYSTGTSAKVWVVTSGKQFCVTRVAA